MTKRQGVRVATKARHRVVPPERLIFWTLVLWVAGVLAVTSVAAEGGTPERPRQFDPFDILAWEILAGLDASQPSAGAGVSDKPLRIAIRPFSKGRGPLPAGFANEYNDKLLVSLLSQGGYRYRFIAREALAAVVKEIDESSAQDTEMDELLAALVESARADVLVVGKLRRTSDRTAVLAYEAVRVRDGTILAATSHQRLAVDPVEVELAARSETVETSVQKAAVPQPDERLETAVIPELEEPEAVEEPERWDEPAVTDLNDAWPDPQVSSIQAGLNKLGYDPGPVDGVYGARTRAAVRAYQLDNRLSPDGKLSAALTESIRADLAGPGARSAGVKPSPLAGANDRYLPKIYGSDGTYCREFQQKLRIGGKEETGYGKACLQSDGSWKIQK